jgi:hypothetical protein
MESSLSETALDALPTKSEKIRALAAAGYSRSEIANILQIRYQHVRNVLLQSGIKAESSKQNASTSKRAEPVPARLWPVDRLLEAGFEIVGNCQITGNDAFEYSSLAPTTPGVYAFAVNGMIAYVGLTRGALRTRLGHYVYGHERQRTSARVKSLILATLKRGDTVEVCVACPPALEWNGLPVDGAAGLETGLIRLIRPHWNKQGAA